MCPHPGPIDNSDLVDWAASPAGAGSASAAAPDGALLPRVNLRLIDDYRLVGGEEWAALLQLFGGGPTLRHDALTRLQGGRAPRS